MPGEISIGSRGSCTLAAKSDATASGSVASAARRSSASSSSFPPAPTPTPTWLRNWYRPETFSGLLVDYAQQKNATVLVRGLRAVSDFEYEFQMALMNRHLAPGLETVFMMPDEKYTYISSRLIKEVFTLGGEITGLVPPIVEEKLRACGAHIERIHA